MSSPPAVSSADLGPAHLARELGNALGDAVAVRDDHDADHR